MTKSKIFLLLLVVLMVLGLIVGCGGQNSSDQTQKDGQAQNESKDTADTGENNNANNANIEVKIGSQNYTDPQIVGEMVKLLIEDKLPGAKVSHTSGLGGSTIIFQGMKAGEFNIYPAYTGTEYMGALGYTEYPESREDVYNIVKKDYKEKFGFTVLDPLGFENTYVLAVRKELAEEYNLKNDSDLTNIAGDLILGTDGTFQERQADGLQAMDKAYGLKWKKTVAMDYGLLYRALANDEVDAVVGYNPDSRIKEFDLVPLKDDKQFFPPYDAVLVVNSKLLEQAPQLKEVLDELSGKIKAEDIVQYMYKIEVEGVSLTDASKEYLQQLGLL